MEKRIEKPQNQQAEKEPILARLQRFLEEDRQKLGGMSLGSSGRLGLEEFRQVFVIEGSIADKTQTPLGMFGTLTPGEVSAARQEPTIDGPQVDKEAVENQNQPSQELPTQQTESTKVDDSAKHNSAESDPIKAAQKQVTASTDVSRERDDKGLSR